MPRATTSTRVRSPSRTAALTLTLALGALVAGCSGGAGDEEGTAATGAVPVTVSIAPQAAFVEAIGGDHVDVTVMVPSGSEPATYEPTAQQVAALSESEVYFSIDVPFERAWLPRFREAAGDLEVVDTTAGVDREELDGGQPDPHIWLAPDLVEEQAQAYADALAEVDPENAEDYEQGLADFTGTVEEVDAELGEELAPYAGESFMIFHPVLDYFAEEYDLQPINIEAGGDEPSASDLRRLVEAGREAGVSAVLVEPQFSQTSARTIADQLGVPVEEVDPLSQDWASNMRDIGDTLAGALEQGA
ncbi:zinc ABC transporter substrate-binding protein [Pseudokineococcus sp. 5B2Z-1]|uniref:metal ABC transporter solute-binding protein, Zn/Mn family n=1 Tax=Pseudokineococcus sp. 5B2Z-1 TaxID=3132744 RepID=UPI0030A87943